MMRAFLAAATFGYFVLGDSIPQVNNTDGLVGKGAETVDELDVDSYLGTWYQMYGNAVVFNTFEKDAYCATAKYGMNENGTISVHNYQTTGSPTTNVQTIDGYAYYRNPEEPGRLTVHFDGTGFDAPYWVLALGPKNADNRYDWSIVSDPVKLFLFVLARDPAEFKEKYDDEVTALLKDLGFTTPVNEPIPTYQETDCMYE